MMNAIVSPQQPHARTEPAAALHPAGSAGALLEDNATVALGLRSKFTPPISVRVCEAKAVTAWE